jgi:hypothetical protein
MKSEKLSSPIYVDTDLLAARLSVRSENKSSFDVF